MRRVLLLLVTLMLFSTAQSYAKSDNFKVSNLLCDSRIEPLSVERVLLSWMMDSDTQGALQSAYQVEMASSKQLLIKGKADVWTSGKVVSATQFDVKPEGVEWRDATEYWWRVRIWNQDGKASAWSAPTSFSMGLLSEESWQGEWITKEWNGEFISPYLRKDFDLKASIKQRGNPVKAMAYICGVGASDLYFNGELVDPTRILDPAQTDYIHFALYSTFDLTDKLDKDGQNCIGVALGNGWYNQNDAWKGVQGFRYGDPMLRFELHLSYKDGSKEIIPSDESWLWQNGPVVYNNIYKGETYDARLEIDSWSEFATSTQGWNKAIKATKGVPPALHPQIIEPIRQQAQVDAKEMWRSSTGRYIYDFGVNRAANIKIKVDLPRGTRLKIRMGESLYNRDSIDFRSSGEKHHGPQSDQYICKGGGVEEWSPRFTYHAFRFADLTIEGCDTEAAIDWVSTYPVNTDLRTTATFECAESQINKLHEIALNTVISNMHGIPTDCPHREKCGWLGDVHAYMDMASINYDMNLFWSKFINDINANGKNTQARTLHHESRNRRFTYSPKAENIPHMIAPGKRECGVASPDWGTTLVQLPWHLYTHYGNLEIIKDNYEYMKIWVDYVETLAINNIVYQGLGDWCPPHGTSSIDTNVAYSSTSFHYRDVHLLSKMASLLGKEEDAEHYAALADTIKDAIYNRFYNPREHTYETHTADALALDFGLVSDEYATTMSDVIKSTMKYKNNFIFIGIFGINRIGKALSRFGNEQTAWEIFTKKGEYSFAYMFETLDDTALREIIPIGSSNAALTVERSHSHPMQAGYDVWFYEDIAGIRPTSCDPGYKTVVFDPTMTDYLPWAKATIETRYGEVVSDWSRNEESMSWKISIPANSTGLVALPKEKSVTVNGETLSKVGFKEERVEQDKGYVRFPAGDYTIQIY